MLTKWAIGVVFLMVAGSSQIYTRAEAYPPDPPRPVVDDGFAGRADDSTARISISVAPQPRTPRAAGSKESSDHGSDGSSGPPDPCYYVPQAAAEASAAGYDPSKGTLLTAKCPMQSNQPGLPDGVRYVSHVVWTLNGAAPAVPPPPDPEVLAKSVAAELTVPAPVLHVGLAGERVAVKVPVALWVDEQPALTASVTAGGLTVSARAVLSSVQWSMGEPVGDPDVGGSGSVASFTCAGAVHAAGSGCGYTFVWRSDAARTDGSGEWQVSAVARWTLSWEATNGARGTIALRSTATTKVRVGEWRVALVDGG